MIGLGPDKNIYEQISQIKSAQQFKTNFSCLIIFRHTEEGWLHKVSSIEKCLWTVKVMSFKEISITPSKLVLLFDDRLILQKIDTAWSSLPIHLIIYIYYWFDSWYFVHSFQKEHLLVRALVICFIWNFWESEGWKLVTVIPITT